MRAVNKTAVILVICFVSIAFMTGCTNWERKYRNLNVAYKNLEGRLEFERQQKGQLVDQVTQGQQTIQQLQRRIEERESAAEAAGFGQGYDVKLDASAGTITGSYRSRRLTPGMPSPIWSERGAPRRLFTSRGTSVSRGSRNSSRPGRFHISLQSSVTW